MSDPIVTWLYRHPDGGDIFFGNGRIVMSEPWDNDEEATAGLPIGVGGLRKLAQSLLALADELEGGVN
jgi:hypothetical protein